MGCLLALEDDDLPITLEIAHKVSSDDDGYPEGINAIFRPTSNDDPALAAADVVGGTAFYFARDENVQAFDWLFVDEAGQVGFANMLAMGRAARNIVLVGDPRQLPQVIQGAHPHPANLSCLDWLLGDHATVPPDRGIFLPTSRRMHPKVCRFISDQVYEGRLQSHPDTARQSVTGTPFPQADAFWVPVAHEGNAQIAPEEVAAISAAAAHLLIGQWTDNDGTTRPLREADIIVVAPYNAQANALRAVLAPASKADFAFAQHMLHHLDDNGTMAVILPHGALFRGGAEGHIRIGRNIRLRKLLLDLGPPLILRNQWTSLHSSNWRILRAGREELSITAIWRAR